MERRWFFEGGSPFEVGSRRGDWLGRWERRGRIGVWVLLGLVRPGRDGGRACRLARELLGHDAAGEAGTDDDDVVAHRYSTEASEPVAPDAGCGSIGDGESRWDERRWLWRRGPGGCAAGDRCAFRGRQARRRALDPPAVTTAAGIDGTAGTVDAAAVALRTCDRRARAADISSSMAAQVRSHDILGEKAVGGIAVLDDVGREGTPAGLEEAGSAVADLHQAPMAIRSPPRPVPVLTTRSPAARYSGVLVGLMKRVASLCANGIIPTFQPPRYAGSSSYRFMPR